MIKYIHCFGTSYSAGGGHEFDGNRDKEYLYHLKNEYKKLYPDEVQTLFNFSYPGQLQKLVGNEIKVINHAKSGYGNERLYRIVWDIVSNPDFNSDEHLFLLEFSGIGRKTIWSNTLNSYIITNYRIEDDNKTLTYNGSAVDYYYDSNEVVNKITKIETEIISPFYKETINMDTIMKQIDMNTDFFLSYMIQFSCKFLFTSPPYYDHNAFFRNEKYYIDFEKNHCFVTYYGSNNYTIESDTNGKCKDGHMGMTGAKIVSKIIYQHLLDHKFIDKK